MVNFRYIPLLVVLTFLIQALPSSAATTPLHHVRHHFLPLQPHLITKGAEAFGMHEVFKAMYAFGESLTDVGNAMFLGILKHASGGTQGLSGLAPGGNHLCDGKLLIDFMCEALGIPPVPAFQNASANFTHGANFAVAGSTALPSNFFAQNNIHSWFLNTIPKTIDLQINWFNKFLQDMSVQGTAHLFGGGSWSGSGSMTGSGGGYGSGSMSGKISGSGDGSVGGSGSGSMSGKTSGSGDGSVSGSGKMSGSGDGSLGGSGSGSMSDSGSGSVRGSGSASGSMTGTGSGSGHGSGSGKMTGSMSGSGGVSGGLSGSGSGSMSGTGAGSGGASMSGSGSITGSDSGSMSSSGSGSGSMTGSGSASGSGSVTGKTSGSGSGNASGSIHTEGALFWIGGIGLSDYPRLLGSSSFSFSFSSQWLTQNSVNQACKLVKATLEKGAIYVVVQGLPPLGCFPVSLALNTTSNRDQNGCCASTNAMVKAHNELLQKSLAELQKTYSSASIIYADFWKAYMNILENHSKYNFVEPFKACCGAGSGAFNFDIHHLCGSINTSTCKDAARHMIWDGIHLTEAMNKAVADQFLHHGCTSPPLQEVIKKKMGSA